MNTTTKKLLKASTITIGLGTSRYATNQPQLTLRTPKGTHYRQLRAALLSLAAELELATPASEHWVAQIDDAGNEVDGMSRARDLRRSSRAGPGSAQARRPSRRLHRGIVWTSRPPSAPPGAGLGKKWPIFRRPR